eukprot:14949348-Ditylum_brightwellii.AAC.1
MGPAEGDGASEGDPACEIRLLNSKVEFSVPVSNIFSCSTPDPADILLTKTDIDPNALGTLITTEDLEKPWHKDQVTLSDDLRVYLYWHQRLQHLPHVTMVRLAKQGVIPNAIKQVRKVPSCAACLFAKAQQCTWRRKGKRKYIRKPCHDAPGKGSSVDHMISHQPGFIPQVTGILTSK